MLSPKQILKTIQRRIEWYQANRLQRKLRRILYPQEPSSNGVLWTIAGGSLIGAGLLYLAAILRAL